LQDNFIINEIGSSAILIAGFWVLEYFAWFTLLWWYAVFGLDFISGMKILILDFYLRFIMFLCLIW
jgi:hypothetical protein